MKKFTIKTAFFTLPFFLILISNMEFYEKATGDLHRIGFIYGKSNYREELMKKFDSIPEKYQTYSKSAVFNIDPSKKTILVIGDSFSRQGHQGYKNYLAHKLSDFQVLYMDFFLTENPLATLISLSNANFFDSIKIDYVLLQSAERAVTGRVENIDLQSKLSLDSLRKWAVDEKSRRSISSKNSTDQFFSSNIIKVPLVNILYKFTPKPHWSSTIKLPLQAPLFSDSANHSILLFYEDDLSLREQNNDIVKITKLNHVLNYINGKLAQKNIELIFLPSPDKYTIYYSYLSSKQGLPKPLFFEQLSKLTKHYLYLDSHQHLQKLLPARKDLYYYDDTHWSPFAAESIAEELIKLIRQNESQKERTKPEPIMLSAVDFHSIGQLQNRHFFL